MNELPETIQIGHLTYGVTRFAEDSENDAGEPCWSSDLSQEIFLRDDVPPQQAGGLLLAEILTVILEQMRHDHPDATGKAMGLLLSSTLASSPDTFAWIMASLLASREDRKSRHINAQVREVPDQFIGPDPDFEPRGPSKPTARAAVLCRDLNLSPKDAEGLGYLKEFLGSYFVTKLGAEIHRKAINHELDLESTQEEEETISAPVTGHRGICCTPKIRAIISRLGMDPDEFVHEGLGQIVAGRIFLTDVLYGEREGLDKEGPIESALVKMGLTLSDALEGGVVVERDGKYVFTSGGKDRFEEIESMESLGEDMLEKLQDLEGRGITQKDIEHYGSLLEERDELEQRLSYLEARIKQKQRVAKAVEALEDEPPEGWLYDLGDVSEDDEEDGKPYRVPDSVLSFLTRMDLTADQAIERGMAFVHNGTLKLFKPPVGAS